MKLLSFDIESCTGSHNDGSLCSFGYVVADENLNFEVQEDLLCNPKPSRFRLRPYSKNKQAEGITLAYGEKVFRAQPKFPGIYPKIKNLFVGDVIAVGFSIENDIQFLNNACDVYGLEFISYRFIDVRQIVELCYGDKYGFGLKTIAENLNISGDSHRSDEDARVTLEILKYVLADKGMTFSEFVDFYGIKPGYNCPTGYANMVSEFGLREALTEKRLTRRQKNGLFEEYVKKICRTVAPVSDKFKGKRFLFNDKFVRDDLDGARRFVKNIYLCGGRYDLTGERATDYVLVSSYDDADKKAKLKEDMPRLNFVRYADVADCFKEDGEAVDFASFDLAALVRISSRINKFKRETSKNG